MVAGLVFYRSDLGGRTEWEHGPFRLRWVGPIATAEAIYRDHDVQIVRSGRTYAKALRALCVALVVYARRMGDASCVVLEV